MSAFARVTTLARAAGVGALALALAPGCKSQAARECASQRESAQAVVMAVQAEDLASVSASVAAVEQAIATCTAAGQTADVEELGKARSQLSQHRDRLVRRNEMREQREQRAEMSPEELARLVEHGDSRCPRGQGYLHTKSKERIVCVGPQPIDMNRAQAEEYFKGRGYRLQPGATDAELRFEYGAELVVLSYADATVAPRCVTLYPPPDRSWQETAARLTGVAPARLKANQPIRRSGGALALSVEESAQKVIARIGTCSS